MIFLGSALTCDVKTTLQVTGSIALALWAVVLLFPVASSGPNSLLTELTWWFAGYSYSSHTKAIEFIIISAVLLGYGIAALRAASKRD